MKKYYILAIIISSLLFSLKAKAQQVDAYFYHAPFYAPGTGTYVETYLAFAGNSLHYMMNPDSMLQASVEVTMVFKNIDEIKEFRKYKVVSPYLPDTTKTFPPFIDLQRVVIPNGVYNFELKIIDNYAPDSVLPFKQSEIITVNIPDNELAFSGVEFLESYTESIKENIFVKNGFECIPYVSDFFPEQMDYLKVYFEVYNLAKELGPLADVLFTFHIENSNTNKPIKAFSSFQKHKAQNVNVLFKSINIKDLPTGNYYFVVEIRDRENNVVVSERKFFQRSNPGVEEKEVDITEVEVNNTFVSDFKNIDSVRFLLNSLRPISDPGEERFIDNQQENSNLKLMKQFFFNFWEKRNQKFPEMAWNEYKQKVDEVQEKYGTRMEPGFITDRGRVYLQYGPPNSIITEKNEANAYPYEIWHYYRIADQTNIKFIFYNKTLMGNDFELLHSNMRGELNNPAWEMELYSRSNSWSPDNSGGRAKEIFEGK